LHGKRGVLEQARDEALRNAGALKQAHDKLAEQVNAEQTSKQALTQQVTSQLRTNPAGDTGPTRAATTATITSLRRLANDQKDLSDLDKRVQDHDELASVYGSFIAIVAADERAAIHGVIASVLFILSILLAGYLGGQLVDRFFAELSPERTRLRTLRVAVRFVIQAVGLLLIVLVVVGAPSQTTTILGLAGAGLTVALKNFIVAFFGWFVLMGRNGIRVGDWVEINGVVGEVVEINLLRTVLLETGNWTDTGHPTGRKVAFVNSFAIEGHFFNLSTTGQWLWDEIVAMVPSGQNPYPMVEAIKAMVTQATEANARLAEQEWQRAAGAHRAQSVSGEPAINLRPTATGVEVHVRYIAQAAERYRTRSRLNQELVRLLHPSHADPGVPGSPKD
jgi:small-conductance mechanosensitive channel